MSDSTEKVTKLESTVQSLLERIQILEAKQDVRTLQHIYGHYLDRCLYNEVVELFADDCEVRFHGGIWIGKEGAKRLYIERFCKTFTGGKNGPVYGFLLDHPQVQDVITVEKGALGAKSRARSFMQAGRHESAMPPGGKDNTPKQWFEGGIYENEYVRESLDSPWKIKVLDYHPLWHGTFDEGWSRAKPNFVPFPTQNELYQNGEGNPNGPDKLQEKQWLWPDTDVVPFHYPHPITGQFCKEEDLRAHKM